MSVQLFLCALLFRGPPIQVCVLGKPGLHGSNVTRLRGETRPNYPFVDSTIDSRMTGIGNSINTLFVLVLFCIVPIVNHPG